MSRTDLEGRFLEVNEAFCKITGYSAEELCSRDYRSITHLDDRSRIEGLKNRLLSGESEFIVMEKRYVQKSGQAVWVRNSVALVRGKHDEPLGFVGLTENINEQKRAEEQLRLRAAASEAAVNAVIITDRKGNIEWVNSAHSRLTGYSAEELIGKNPRILKSGQHPESLYDQMWKTIRSGKVWRGQLTNRRKDGTKYTEDMMITPVKDEGGEVTHFIAIKQDVTERRLLEEMYAQAQRMEVVGMLAGGVAHDFNNLLVVIVGYAELLLASPSLSERDKAKIAEMLSAGKRGSVVTRQLLAFSRRQVLDPKVLNLNHVVVEAASLLQRLIGEEVRLRMVLYPALGAVKADASQLELLMMNLAVNARDAMPRGGVLSMETSNVDIDAAAAEKLAGLKPGPHVLLGVRDNGTGMDEATKARAFEPFFTTKEAGSGTGLGLATVYSIVQQSDGWIGVQSEPGKGTMFLIYLPQVQEAAESIAPAGEPANQYTGTETVLLLEDEEAARAVAFDLLEHCGYKVLQASSGKQALQLATRHEGLIHLLMTDVVLPEMGGMEVAESLLAVRPDMKVIYASGYTDDTLLRQGRLPPGRAFLQKPYSLESLAKKIREVLGSAA